MNLSPREGDATFSYTITPSEGLVLYVELNVAVDADQSHKAVISMSSGDIVGGSGTDVTFSGITTGDVSLPVQAIDFVVKADGGSVTLSWSTQSEINNAGFNILRTLSSEQGTLNYELDIASYTSNNALKGLGTSTTGRAYQFVDSKVKSGATYNYKIQSVNHNGTTKVTQ